VSELRREEKEYKHASRNSMGVLMATTRYAIQHLYISNDLVAARKLEDWIEYMEENMQPVTNVTHLIELLEEWCAAMPCDDPELVSVTWMKTMAVIKAAKGSDADTGGVPESDSQEVRELW
jgi:hypothetical protein